MKKNVLQVLFIVFCCYISFSQIKFQKRYGIGNLYNFLTSVVQNPDKTYIMAGHGVNVAQYELDVVKTDSIGNVLWAKRYYSPIFVATDYYESGKLIRTSDGGYIICGTRKTEAFVMKLDASGNVSWSKTYYISGASYHFLNNIKQTSDGGYIAVGYLKYSTNDSTDAFIVKITNNGSLTWGARWNNQTVNSDDAFLDVAEDVGSGYIAVGYTSQVFGSDTTWDALIVKFNTNGGVVWSNVLGSDNNDEQASVIIKQGTNFYIAGNTTQGAIGTDIFFMQMSPSGYQNWVKRFGYGLADLAFKILPLPGGGFSVVGGEITMGGNIIKADFDATGQYIVNTAYAYGGSWAFPTTLDAQKTTDNGWIIGVMSIDYAYYLLKANSSGSTGCYENTFNPAITTFTFNQDAFTGTLTTNVTSGNPSVTTSSFTINNIVTDCQFIPCDTPVVNITPANPSICQGQSITLTASGSNGSGPCTSWSWSTGQTTASINVSPTSTTTYTVTGYVGSCPSNPVSVQVNVNPVPTAQITGPTAICQGNSATLTASGGTSYLWSNNQTTASIQVSPTTTTQYTVTVSNQYNCTATATHTLTVNSLPLATISGPNSVCAGSQITLTANGGSTYQWSTQQTTQQINVSPNVNTTYYVTVTDNNGCSATASHNVVVNPVPVVSFAGDTSICEGQSTTIIASGGDTYLWSNGSTTNSINVTGPSGSYTYSVTVSYTTGCSSVRTITVNIHPNPSASATGGTTICQGQSVQLQASGGILYSWSPTTSLNNPSIPNPIATPNQTTTYIVTVSNEWSCTATASTTVNVLESPQFTAVITHVKCYGESNGSITLQNITGQPPFSFLWSNGANTQNISNLSVGQYTVTVTNAIGCSTVQQFTITQPQPLTGNTTINNVSCYGGNNGNISLSITGGTPPYSYNWSNGQNTSNAISLTQGTYSVTITDANGCSLVLGNLIVNQPATSVSVIVDSIKHVSCYGLSDGYIKISGNGGTPPYTYHWSNGQNGNYIVNLNANTYYVTVTDANNCIKIDSIKLTQPLPLAIQATIKKPSCLLANDGRIIVNINGGTPPYSYIWNTTDTTNVFNNLSEGTYYLTVSDKNSCKADTSLKLQAEPVECLIIPNIITPNGDGKNDRFEIKGIQFYDYVKVEIFDRWGDKIFAFEGSGIEYFNIQNQWDGSYQGKKECSPCSFIYIVDVKDNNSPYNGIVTVMK
ncbi:MAG: gliding motility-associated C-terminal domain-containing protein [Bacteroidales bacterium]|nr:gliding motility-associated C-terminal domain-containing protein [Bacteroidales bacterium]